MKRVLQFSEWLTNEVLENVIHQQYVFTMPKIIRPYFKYDSYVARITNSLKTKRKIKFAWEMSYLFYKQ